MTEPTLERTFYVLVRKDTGGFLRRRLRDGSAGNTPQLYEGPSTAISAAKRSPDVEDVDDWEVVPVRVQRLEQ
ncbi:MULTISPECIES: hypothetical protein [unclassified Chelatococcus]|uniref:hypothetical protein n=1 Tax=unclassified Chelatococcus TaxID=2638111 RepID=UPI0002E2DC3C|nr:MULTISPECIES: hypothetical protein [unclassified Chelatococcus]ALA16100.1 hypothetical protein AL346_00190 [Chelatococcus sp. CO-6]